MGLGTWKNSEHRLHIVSGNWKKFPFFIWALELGKIPHPSFLLSSGTWKSFKLRLYIGLHRLWDLEKFHVGALGFEKMFLEKDTSSHRQKLTQVTYLILVQRLYPPTISSIVKSHQSFNFLSHSITASISNRSFTSRTQLFTLPFKTLSSPHLRSP